MRVGVENSERAQLGTGGWVATAVDIEGRDAPVGTSVKVVGARGTALVVEH